MGRFIRVRKVYRRLLALTLLMALVAICQGRDKTPEGKTLKEPVYRVSTVGDRTHGAEAQIAKRDDEPAEAHPLDPAIEMAREALTHVQTGIQDYTCTMVKQERVDGVLLEPEYMFARIRNRQVEGDRTVVPFSVYMKFLKPASIKGREVIYVEKRNSGKMVAHEGGVRGKFLPTVWLHPTSPLAMRNNRYPITEIGIARLTERLIEQGERERTYEECKVEFFQNATINGRKCSWVQVTHPHRRPHFDFHVARIFLDDELRVPVRYEAYDWPIPGSQMQMIEAYTYLNVRVNVGLTDEDFDHENESYNF